MANKWDDFHENLGDEQAALHMSGAFDSSVGHDHDPALPGRGAQISYNNLKDKPSSLAPSAHAASHAQGGTDALSGTHNINITGSAGSVTLAEATKGDVRFQLSGNILSTPSIPGNSNIIVQNIKRTVPAGKSLILKRANFLVSGSSVNVRLQVDVTMSNVWISSGNYGDISPNFTIYTAGAYDLMVTICVRIYNSSAEAGGSSNPSGWWLDLAIE